MELVPIFISAIPGQEEHNVMALRRYGVGISPRNMEDLKNIIMDFREHPEKLMSMKNSIKKIKKPEALTEICNVICQGSAGPCG